MPINSQISVQRLILSLSEAMDYVSPLIADHQLRVAYMATKVAQVMGYRENQLRDVFHAAALHDIGLIRPIYRKQPILENELRDTHWHCDVGYELLKYDEILGAIAPVILFHHVTWNNQQKIAVPNISIPKASFIISLCDIIDRSIRRDTPVLYQLKEVQELILGGKGKEFSPDCVDAFLEASGAPAFWLDATSKRIYSILNDRTDWPILMIDENRVGKVVQVFSRIVDSLSPWTATHSAGVASTAVLLAERLRFSPREQSRMNAAGYLHDIGKITVPVEILDSPNKPTEEERAILIGHTYHTFRILDSIDGIPDICEWAAFHHERMDGKGYPFGHNRKNLTLGSRIMAIADTFTAITEDRPYRKGMKRSQACKVLDIMRSTGALDGDVVNVLFDNYDEILAVRKKAQSSYSMQQERIFQLMKAS